jgi:sugar/nucleoside kinase (ribokinase family)
LKALVVGDLIVDTIVAPKGPVRPNTDNHSTIRSELGGSAANIAGWLAVLGVETHLLARVGKPDGKGLRTQLEAKNVIPHLQEDNELQTGRIVVLVEGNQRSFFTDRGANQNLQAGVIPVDALGDVLFISGYSVLDLGTEGTQKLIGMAKTNGMVVVCDPGSSGFIADYGVKYFLEAIQGVDILIPNLDEALVLSGEQSFIDAAERLHERYPLVAITLGEKGAYVRNATTAELVPAVDAQLVDPTGAGDAFAAMFVRSILDDRTAALAAAEANLFASQAISQFGASPKG